MAEKYYAVAVGKTPGIYRDWAITSQMVTGYPGAVYKSFKTEEEAIQFMQVKSDQKPSMVKSNATDFPAVYAFTDGSYHEETGVYGYGGFLVYNGEKEILQGSGDDPEMASMRNVAGEILGSMAAMKKAMELGLKEVTIYYDYLGIEMWATGGWKRNKAGTIAYYDFVQSIKSELSIHFVKVKGHSGVEGNEEADRLAKEAVGIG